MVTGRFCCNSLRPFGAPPSVREALAGEVLRIRRRVGGCGQVLLQLPPPSAPPSARQCCQLKRLDSLGVVVEFECCMLSFAWETSVGADRNNRSMQYLLDLAKNAFGLSFVFGHNKFNHTLFQ